jgi:hypothetical protein
VVSLERFYFLLQVQRGGQFREVLFFITGSERWSV